MRVLLLTSQVSWSGVEVHTVNWARALKERGHDVAIVDLGHRGFADAPQPLPCQVIHVPLGPGPSRKASLDALGFGAWRRIFSTLRADVAVAVKGTFQFGNLAMEAAGRMSFPCFLAIEHYHAPLGERLPAGPSSRPFSSSGLWWYRQRLAGFLRSLFPHKVICVSEALALTLKNDYCYPASKLVVAHSGVDTAAFAPAPSFRAKAREAWGIPEDALVFGSLGRLSPMKNHGQLISAFARLCKSDARQNIRLVIVGDGPLRTHLEAHAESLGVRQHVTFAGFSAEPQVACQGFDVFCFPSTTGESLGIALLEAMSCGCPPIASAVGGVPEILNDRSLGWLISADDEVELFSAMRAAMGLDKEALRQMGARARERVVRHFNADDRWVELASVVESAFERANRNFLTRLTR